MKKRNLNAMINAMLFSDILNSKNIKEYVFKSPELANKFDNLITSEDYLKDLIIRNKNEIFGDENLSISDSIIDDDNLPEYKNGHLVVTLYLKDLLESFFTTYFDWEKELSNINNLINASEVVAEDIDYRPLQEFIIKRIKNEKAQKIFNEFITLKIK